RVKRFIIETDLKVQGETYRIKIGLADRSDMRKPVLIGRRFLREHNILVDVRINQEYDDEGERIK
ncbi:MAG: RimK/LysX family protein, partial [Candidatus Saccharimonadales bacterium]